MTPPATATARSATRTAPRPRRAPVRHPRRISGPASPARAATAAAGGAVALPAPGIALRAVDAFEGLSSSAVLDRLIRGRAWIGLLAFALIGMVAMQLLVLKLNTGIGHTLEHVAQLQRANAQLGIENSTSTAENRIAPSAVSAGMILPPAGTVHFVAASRADVSRAASALGIPIQTPSIAPSQSTEGTSGESKSSATGESESSSASASGSGEATEAEASSATGPGPRAAAGESASLSGASSESGG
jgi:hypothetical protein